jgi:serine/threonine-protein kinase
MNADKEFIAMRRNHEGTPIGSVLIHSDPFLSVSIRFDPRNPWASLFMLRRDKSAVMGNSKMLEIIIGAAIASWACASRLGFLILGFSFYIFHSRFRFLASLASWRLGCFLFSRPSFLFPNPKAMAMMSVALAKTGGMGGGASPPGPSTRLRACARAGLADLIAKRRRGDPAAWRRAVDDVARWMRLGRRRGFMWIIRRLLHFVSGVIQFTLYSALFFVLMVAAGYWVASAFFGGKGATAPDLTGLTLQEALTRLQPIGAGLQLERLQPHVQVPEGRVISQYPPAGSTIKAGSPIRVVVSKGQPLAIVPDLRGRNKIEAGIRLRKIGLNIGAVATIPRQGVLGGSVLATDPPPGAGVLDGTAVNLLLAAGEGARVAQMPNLLGLSRDEATEVLRSYGLQAAEERAADAPDAQVGHVHDQSPKPGERVEPGTRIVIFYQPPRVEVPPSAGRADQEQTTKSQEIDEPATTDATPAQEDRSTSGSAPAVPVIPSADSSQNAATPAGRSETPSPDVPKVEVPAPASAQEATSTTAETSSAAAPAVKLDATGNAASAPR